MSRQQKTNSQTNPIHLWYTSDMKKNQKRSVVSLIIAIVILIAIGGGVFVYINRRVPIIIDNQNNSENETLFNQTSLPAVKFEGRYIDVHTHISPAGMSLEQIIATMDSEGIDKMIIMKVPANTSETQAQYGIPEVAQQYPDRFIALYGGEAITMLETAATSGNYTKADEKKFASLLESEMASGKYKGFGEIGLRHFIPKQESGATDLTIAGDHPWMFIMSDIAAKYNVPIDIHMEATDETIRSFEILLDYNKNTKIIWDHAGWSSTGMSTPAIVGQLMNKHSNLYLSIKMRNDKSASSEVNILNADKTITPEWMTLFKEYPDRFMIGSDIKAGIRADEFSYVKDHLIVLGQLPSEILKQIERENAIEIFGIQ